MKRNLKRKTLACLAVAFSLSIVAGLGAVFNETYVASAAENVLQEGYTFTMGKGASVGLTKDGLRFVAKMDKKAYDYIVTDDTENKVTLTIRIAPRTFFEATKDKDGNYHPENLTSKLDITFGAADESKIYGDGEYYYANGCMTNLAAKDLQEYAFVGVGVIQADGKDKVFASFFDGDIENNTRTQREVLNKAILDVNHDYCNALLGESSPYGWLKTSAHAAPVTVGSAEELASLKTQIEKYPDAFTGVEAGVLKSLGLDTSGIANPVDSYNVTFLSDGAVVKKTVAKRGASVSVPNAVKKEYDLSGWTAESGDYTDVQQDIIVNAVWSKSRFNVNFIGDGIEKTISVKANETAPALKDEEGALGRQIVGYYTDAAFTQEFDIANTAITQDTNVYVKLSDYVYFNGAMLKQFAPVAGASTTLNADGTLTMTGVKGSFIYKKALNLAMNDTNGIEIKLKLNGVSRVDIYAFGAYVLDGQGGSNDNYGQQYTQFRGLSANGWSVVQDGEYAIMTYDLSYAGGTSSLNFAYTVINGFRIDIMEINTSAENPTITVDYVKSIKIEKSYAVNYYVGGAVKKTATVKGGEKAIALKDEEVALGRQIVGYYTDAAFTQVFDIANTAITQDTNVYVKLSDYAYFNGAMLKNGFTGGDATKTLNADGTLSLYGVDVNKYIHQKGLNLAVEGANRVVIRAKRNGVYRLDLYLFGNYTLDGENKVGTDYVEKDGGMRYRGVDASYGYSMVNDGEYVIMTYDLSYANGNTAKNLVFNLINGFRIDIIGVNNSVANSSVAIDYVKIIKE